MEKFRLAVIQTHPIQYYSPFYRLLSAEDEFVVKVFYTWPQAAKGFFDPKFKKRIRWDIPLLEGYEFEMVKNISPRPGSQSFFGTVNPALIKTVRSWNPDAVMVVGWRHYSHLRAMVYFKGKVPVLFRGDSTLLDEQPGIKQKLRRIVLKTVYRFTDYALYVGTQNKKYFLAHGLKPEQLVFVPHAVENSRFYDTDGSKERQARQWRRELGINERNLVFLYAGKFEPKKNVSLLVRAFRSLSVEDLRLVLVGSGEKEAELRQLATGDSRIIFLPFQNQSKMPLVYRLGDVFVLPSAWEETWGLAVNEAMASGRAVLVSDRVGCAVDLVKPGLNGYIFQSGNEQDLSEKMRLFSIEKALQMGQKSRAIIKEWSYEKGVRELQKLLKLIKFKNRE